ncbi:cell cycle checkpoint protein RAD17 [Hetaerina americana]|uniref:cell cycle checkpoint protein RAD17 n=1 Tax=Hetaerina americana TaxID=62018 RepID=UPI003A7F26A0
MSWVNPDFSAGEASSSKATVRGPTDVGGVACSREREEIMKHRLWVECFAPENKEQLAVHANKVHDVEAWLNEAFLGSMGAAPLALIVGPSGSGKTITLRVLARSMNCEIKEWINPTSSKQHSNILSSQPRNDTRRTSGQVEQFEDFLFRASRYQDLLSGANSKSLLLVEDFPNIFLRDASLFEKTLRKYVEVGRSPLVFISSSGQNEIEKTLFKPHLMSDLKIVQMSFNAANKTLMSRALERVKKLALKEDPKLVPNATISVEDIVALSNGDVRFAVNHLQLLMKGSDGGCHTPSKKVVPKQMRKEKMGPSGIVPYGLKDQNSDVFKFLGRVLYNNRENVIHERTGQIEARPKYDPEEIASKMSSVSNLFHGLLTENYAGIMDNMKKVADASCLLSQTDVLMARTAAFDKELNKVHAITICVHGLMNLPPDNAQRKFFSFKGSRAKDFQLLVKERHKTVTELFPGTCLQPRTMMTEVLPYLMHINPAALSSVQKKFISELANPAFIRKKYVKPTRPEENYHHPGDLQDMHVLNVHTSPATQVSVMDGHVDELISIEEFSSDDE